MGEYFMMSEEELEALKKLANGAQDDKETTNAQRSLGIYYYKGEKQGKGDDWLRAMDYFLAAAKQHDFLAMVFIGDMFFHGNQMEHIPKERGYAYMFYYMAATTEYWNIIMDKKNNAANNAIRKLYEARDDFVDLKDRLEELQKFLTKGQIKAYEILAEEFLKNESFTYTSVDY